MHTHTHTRMNSTQNAKQKIKQPCYTLEAIAANMLFTYWVHIIWILSYYEIVVGGVCIFGQNGGMRCVCVCVCARARMVWRLFEKHQSIVKKKLAVLVFYANGLKAKTKTITYVMAKARKICIWNALQTTFRILAFRLSVKKSELEARCKRQFNWFYSLNIQKRAKKYHLIAVNLHIFSIESMC